MPLVRLFFSSQPSWMISPNAPARLRWSSLFICSASATIFRITACFFFSDATALC